MGYIARIYAMYAIAVQYLAPELKYVIAYTLVFTSLYGQIVFKHVVLSTQAIGMGIIAQITLTVGWYIIQERELMRFNQQQELERKEQLAVMRE